MASKVLLVKLLVPTTVTESTSTLTKPAGDVGRRAHLQADGARQRLVEGRENDAGVACIDLGHDRGLTGVSTCVAHRGSDCAHGEDDVNPRARSECRRSQSDVAGVEPKL